MANPGLRAALAKAAPKTTVKTTVKTTKPGLPAAIPVPPPPKDQGFGTAFSEAIMKQSAVRKKAQAARTDTAAAKKAGYAK